ncbi:DUF4258 domain-containing protein [Flavobacteriaceae bacterium M23B6Z8]
MGLLKRIGFYLGGFALGLIILAFIFKGKDTEFCYSPNCRVLKNIRTKKIDYAQDVAIDSIFVKTCLKEGDVIFSKSDTKSTPCKTYVIQEQKQNITMEISVKNCDSTATIQYLKKID